MAKIKVYEITKELNNDTKTLLNNIKKTHQQLDNYMQSIKTLNDKLLAEETKKKEMDEAQTQEQKRLENQSKGNIKQAQDLSRSQTPRLNADVSNTKSDNRSITNQNNGNAPVSQTRTYRNQGEQATTQRNDGLNKRQGESFNRGPRQQSDQNERRNYTPRFERKQDGDYKPNNYPQGRNRTADTTARDKKDNRDYRDNAHPGAAKRKPPVDKAIASEIVPPVEKEKVSNYDPNKNNYVRDYDPEKKKAKSKKSLVKESVVATPDLDEERPKGSKKLKNKRGAAKTPPRRIEPIKIEKATVTSEMVPIKELAEKIGKPASEIIKKLLILGTLATINQELDFDTAALVSSEFGVELEQKLEKTYEEVLIDEDKDDNPADMIERPPVVTIMGHVDHGKTSLLDAIRQTRVTSQEAGGITQHIGASTINVRDKAITFLDTPGHEAFTAMRSRGAQVTDIAVLVVAADDGVMPQTVEAINHAKAANVPIIVAINKIDKPAANPDRVKQELTEYELLAEEWGGETIMVPVSAATKEGIDHLLEMIILVAELQELKANPNRLAKGTIIEAQLDKGRGPVATVLVQNGTLKVGDTIVAGISYGRVRAMMNDRGERVDTAGPSQPVEVLGFSEVPEAGDILYAVEVEKLSRQVVEERKDKLKALQIKATAKVSLDELFNQIAEGEIKDLNIIIKADVQGSVEAVKQSLEKLSNEQVRVKIIHGGVGAVTESDVLLANASNAIIIGFNVRPDPMARQAAEKEKVDVRTYRVIYNAIEDIEKAMKGLLDPEYKEVVLGHAEVRQTFKVSGIGTIAGCYITDGKVLRNAKVRLLRNSIVIYEGKMDSLKRFKDDAREVAAGYECGIGLENYNDIKLGDVIEAYVEEEIER